MIDRRGHVRFFESILPALEAGQAHEFFGFAPKDALRNPTMDVHLDKLGNLGGELPAHVTRFIQVKWGIRLDLSRLVAGEFGKEPGTVAKLIRQDLELMAEMRTFGHDLARRLRRSAGW